MLTVNAGALLTFIGLASEFFWRYAHDRPAKPELAYQAVSRPYGRPPLNPKLKQMSFALALATMFIFIR